jgi:hypothetical protein
LCPQSIKRILGNPVLRPPGRRPPSTRTDHVDDINNEVSVPEKIRRRGVPVRVPVVKVVLWVEGLGTKRVVFMCARWLPSGLGIYRLWW